MTALDDQPRWVRSLLGAVPRSLVKGKVGPVHQGPRLVDIVCPSCNERVAMVEGGTTGPTFVVWQPHMMVMQPGTTSSHVALAVGKLPDSDDEIGVHCLTHGHLSIRGEEIRLALAEYRNGRGRRTARVRATPPSARHA